MSELVETGPDGDLPPSPAAGNRTEFEEVIVTSSLNTRGTRDNIGTHLRSTPGLRVSSEATQSSLWFGGVWSASLSGVTLPAGLAKQCADFTVSPGFPIATERMLAGLAPMLFERVSEWPELRGVRAAVRLYRFASSDEKDLDLVRVELRIPGIGLDERYPLWRKFRLELEKAIQENTGRQDSVLNHRAARELKEVVSTIVVG
jgi:hypothetical protein